MNSDQGTRETEVSRAEDEYTDEEDWVTNEGSIPWPRSMKTKKRNIPHKFTTVSLAVVNILSQKTRK